MRTLIRSIRNTVSKRPLCFACGLFLFLLFAALYTEWRYALTVGLCALLLAIGALVCFFLCPKGHRFGSMLSAGILFAVSAALLTAHISVEYSYHRKIDSLIGRSGQAVLVVTRPKRVTVYSASCEGRLISLDGKEVGLEGVFYFPYEADLQTGDRLTVDVTLSPIREAGADLSDSYALSQGLFFNAEVNGDSFLKVGKESLFPYSLTAALRDWLTGILKLYLPDDACGLASALFLGDRSGLPEALSLSFGHLGISHTLAVSGLHLGILLGSLSWLLKKLHIPRRAHLWVLLPITLLYILLVGTASVLRAGGMLLLLLFAHRFGRRRDPLTSLFATVTLICLISPFSVLDIGLQLSFLSTFGILLVGLPLTARCQALPSPLRWLTDSLILTASALTFTLPHSIWYFGELSLISPLANLLFVPLITLLLYLIPLLLLLSPLPLLAATPAYALRLLSELTFSAAQLLGGQDSFMLTLELPLVRTIGLIWLALCIVLLCPRKTRSAVIVCTAVFLAFASICVYWHTLEIADGHELFAYSDGENDALLLRDGTRVLLCDASGGGYRFLSDAIEYAERDPAVRVDSLLLTHYHAAMRSTITDLLEDGHIEYLILPLPDSTHADLAATLEERAERGGCSVRYYSKDECMIGYHRYELLIDIESVGAHPLNALTVMYNEQCLLHYAAQTDALPSEQAPLLPANHNAEVPTDPALWNRRYD